MTEGGFAADRAAVREICTDVRTTLGPFGANKLVVERGGSVSVTSRGVDVIEKLDGDGPGVRLLRDAARSFRDRHGDGTSTLLALTGALLVEAEFLRERGLHPTTIENGYRRSAALVADRIERAARPLSDVGRAAVPETALTSLRNPTVKRRTAEFLADVARDISPRGAFDASSVKIEARTGGSYGDTSLVNGVVMDKKPAYEGMPRRVEDAGVALLSSTVDIRRIGSQSERTSDVDVSLSVSSYEDRAAVRDHEIESFRESVRRAAEAGCRFLATSRAVSDRVKAAVAEHGILAVQRVDREDMALLAEATGASVVPHLDQVTPEVLGRADASIEREAGRDVTFVRSTGERPVWTVFCRAPDPRSVDAFERSATAAMQSLALAERSGTVVPGGGAIETSAARRVRSGARSVASREQVVMESFADALTVIPRTLAENGGLDGTTALTRLSTAHGEGRETVGVDCTRGAVTDVLRDDPIVDPPRLKRAIVEAAVDTAVQFVRIDARLAATDLSASSAPASASASASSPDDADERSTVE
jgi:chaperonin GroEL (HSP60 family)